MGVVRAFFIFSPAILVNVQKASNEHFQGNFCCLWCLVNNSKKVFGPHSFPSEEVGGGCAFFSLCALTKLNKKFN